MRQSSDQMGTGLPEQELIEHVINIKRVSKVMKGGKRMKLSAAVVVGDGRGQVGLGHGKASEVAAAVRKATTRARKDMIRVSIKGHTIPHETNGKYGASRVMVRPAAPGTGLIACPQVRAVLHAAGLSDALSKSLGSRNPFNTARATIRALAAVRSIEQIASVRNKSVRHLVAREENEPVEGYAG
ncbi:MAG: 30S ribosomal protein S5 [bacterium]